MPSVVRPTGGEGIATPSHIYVDQTTVTPIDSSAGVAAAMQGHNVVYYGFDWRHAGRFAYEPNTSGARRLLLGALDFIDQYGGVLPVEVVNFTAEQLGHQEAVSLAWKTASESDVRSLEVERAEVTTSEAGEVIGDYGVVTRTASTGTPEQGSSYTALDRGVKMNHEYAYRLVTVNLEGVRSVAAESRVRIAGSAGSAYSLTVLPNPVRTTAQIAYRAPAGEAVTLGIYDAAGRQVKSVSATTSAGSITIDARELASGTYTLRMETTSGQQLVEKLVVRH